MHDDQIIDVIAIGLTLQDALSDLLRSVLNAIDHSSSLHGSPNITTRIRADADDLPSLINDLMGQLTRVGQEFGADVIFVTIDGFRTLDPEVRAWGSVGLSSPSTKDVQDIRTVATPIIRQNAAGWSISASIAIT